MKIDWKRKLTSRKLWVSLAGFVAGLIVIFGGSQEDSDKISGSILSGAAVVGYILGEGLTDATRGCAETAQKSGTDAALLSGLGAANKNDKED